MEVGGGGSTIWRQPANNDNSLIAAVLSEVSDVWAPRPASHKHMKTVTPSHPETDRALRRALLVGLALAVQKKHKQESITGNRKRAFSVWKRKQQSY